MNYKNLKKAELIKLLQEKDQKISELEKELNHKNQVNISNYQHAEIYIGKKSVLFYDKNENKYIQKPVYLYIHKNEKGEIFIQSDDSILIKPNANNSISLIIENLIMGKPNGTKN